MFRFLITALEYVPMNTATASSIATQRLEIAVERLYEFLNHNDLIDWKVKISHPLATVKGYESNATADRIDCATIDIDSLTLRVMSKMERKAKKKAGKMRPN